MKLYFILLGCLLFLGVDAQNRSIVFQEESWNEILKQAQKEKKMIFVDCYTSWCGPCKMLAKNIFTRDSVADFYNRNFLCVKIDMEKGDGPTLAKRYEVAAYPTLLYIDEYGKLKHAVAGFQTADVLIQNGKLALAGDMTLEAMQARYDSGERDVSFVKRYMDVLFQACRPSLQEKVASEYIAGLTDREFYSRSTWELIVKNLSDPLSPILKKVVANKFRFENIVCKDTFDLFQDYIFRSAINSFVWKDLQASTFDSQRYDSLLCYISTLNFFKVPQYLATLYAVQAVVDGNMRALLDEMHRSVDYGIFYDPDAKLDFIRAFFRQIERTGDANFLKEADLWLDDLIAEAVSGYFRSEYMKVKARIVRVLGNEDLANELERKAPLVRMQ